MIKKISNLFKKGNNDWLKVTVSIVISAVMVMFFSKTIATSYAIPNTLPDTLTSGMGDNSERINLFNELYGDELLYLVPYYATSGSTRYTVYCLDKEKEWAPNHTITKDNAPLDAGYVYLIQNGYPAKSLTGNDAYDDYLTQIAVWWYQDLYEGTSNLTSNQKSVIQSSSYYRYIESLINGAVNASKNPVVINPSFSINSSNFKLSSDNKYLITDTITVNSNVNFDSYAVSVNNSAVEVLDSNNSPVTGTINSGSGFKLRVNLANISNPINVNISVTVNYTEYEAYSYTPDNELMQNALPAALVPVSKQKTVSSNVGMPTGSLTIKKVDSETNSPLAGANIEVRRVITNQVVASFTTSTKDYTISNLLPGEYTIKETSAPSGYELNTSTYNVVINTNNLNISQTVKNIKENEVRLGKIDADTGKLVAGATLKLTNSEGKEVETFVTTTEPYIIRGLDNGTYYLEEVTPPPGYLLNEKKVTININDNERVYTYNISNEKNKVEIVKRDASTGEIIAGATLKVTNSSGDEVETFVTTTEPYIISGLTPGQYVLEEISAPAGYVSSNSKIIFEVLNTGKVQEVSLDSDFISISVNNKKLVIDAKGKEGYSFNLKDSNGNLVEKINVTDKVYTSKELDLGDYSLEEVSVPDGNIKNKTPYYFSVTDSNIVSSINYTNDFTKVEISKKDITNSEEVAGAHLVIKDSNGKVVEEWTSTDTPHYIERLPVGKYTLTETIAPDGYILNTSVVDFEVLETGEVQTAVMFNSKPVEVPNTSSNAIYIYIIGGVLIVVGASIMIISKKKKKK